MSTTIELTPKITKWALLFNGITNTAIGANILLQAESLTNWIAVLAWFLVIAGPILFIYGILLFFPDSRFSPTFKISEEGISIKSDFTKKRADINWNSIKEITYRSFQIEFRLKSDECVKIPLQTNANISIKIKKAVRDFAGINDVQVVGG